MSRLWQYYEERKLFDLLRAKAERQLNRTSKTSNSQGKVIDLCHASCFLHTHGELLRLGEG